MSSFPDFFYAPLLLFPFPFPKRERGERKKQKMEAVQETGKDPAVGRWSACWFNLLPCRGLKARQIKPTNTAGRATKLRTKAREDRNYHPINWKMKLVKSKNSLTHLSPTFISPFHRMDFLSSTFFLYGLPAGHRVPL
jgi:hypothetical protein